MARAPTSRPPLDGPSLSPARFGASKLARRSEPSLRTAAAGTINAYDALPAPAFDEFVDDVSARIRAALNFRRPPVAPRPSLPAAAPSPVPRDVFGSVRDLGRRAPVPTTADADDEDELSVVDDTFADVGAAAGKAGAASSSSGEDENSEEDGDEVEVDEPAYTSVYPALPFDEPLSPPTLPAHRQAAESSLDDSGSDSDEDDVEVPSAPPVAPAQCPKPAPVVISLDDSSSPEPEPEAAVAPIAADEHEDEIDDDDAEEDDEAWGGIDEVESEQIDPELVHQRADFDRIVRRPDAFSHLAPSSSGESDEDELESPALPSATANGVQTVEDGSSSSEVEASRRPSRLSDYAAEEAAAMAVDDDDELDGTVEDESEDGSHRPNGEQPLFSAAYTDEEEEPFDEFAPAPVVEATRSSFAADDDGEEDLYNDEERIAPMEVDASDAPAPAAPLRFADFVDDRGSAGATDNLDTLASLAAAAIPPIAAARLPSPPSPPRASAFAEPTLPPSAPEPLPGLRMPSPAGTDSSLEYIDGPHLAEPPLASFSAALPTPAPTLNRPPDNFAPSEDEDEVEAFDPGLNTQPAIVPPRRKSPSLLDRIRPHLDAEAVDQLFGEDEASEGDDGEVEEVVEPSVAVVEEDALERDEAARDREDRYFDDEEPDEIEQEGGLDDDELDAALGASKQPGLS